jgi:hypothetical protein
MLILKNKTNLLLNEYHNNITINKNKCYYLKLNFLNIIILGSSLKLQKYLNNLKFNTSFYVLSVHKIIKIYFYIMYTFLLNYRIAYNFDKLKSISRTTLYTCTSILKNRYNKNKS